MYRKKFGLKEQIKFDSEADYYQFLGFLAKNNGATNIVWEENDDQGAWGQEGRIEFFSKTPISLRVSLKHTKGRGGAMVSRVNCNDFVRNIANSHGFIYGKYQNIEKIRATVPLNFKKDFDHGLLL